MNFTNKETDLDFSVRFEKEKTAKKYKKKVIRKMKIAFFLLLIIVIFTYFFLTIGGGRFTSFNNKLLFVSSLSAFFLIGFTLLYIHLNVDVKLKHYLEYYQLYDIIQFIVLTVVILVFFQMFIFKTASISGPSMLPTLKNGDEVFIVQTVRNYKKDDIVVIDASKYNSNEEDEYYVKRIKGLPGETFKLNQIGTTSNYEIVINNKSLKDINGDIITIIEGSVHYENLKQMPELIPKGFYFLLGDNVEKSKDSRSFGLVRKEDLMGKVNFRIWRKFGIIK